MVGKKLLGLSVDVEQAKDKLALQGLASEISTAGRDAETKIMLESDMKRIIQSLRNTLSGKSV
jgi:hypothetical protein